MTHMRLWDMFDLSNNAPSRLLSFPLLFWKPLLWNLSLSWKAIFHLLTLPRLGSKFKGMVSEGELLNNWRNIIRTNDQYLKKISILIFIRNLILLKTLIKLRTNCGNERWTLKDESRVQLEIELKYSNSKNQELKIIIGTHFLSIWITELNRMNCKILHFSLFF